MMSPSPEPLDPIDAALADASGDAVVASVVADVRAAYLPSQHLPLRGELAALVSAHGARAGTTFEREAAPRRRRLLALVASATGTVVGKLALGGVVAAAAVGGIAASGVDLPLVPGGDEHRPWSVVEVGELLERSSTVGSTIAPADPDRPESPRTTAADGQPGPVSTNPSVPPPNPSSTRPAPPVTPGGGLELPDVVPDVPPVDDLPIELPVTLPELPVPSTIVPVLGD